jgi:hypothetical protein
VRWLITISAIAQMLRVCSMSIRSLNSILLPYLDASRLYNCPGKYPVHTNIYSSFLLRHEKEISKRSVEHDCKFQLWSHDIDEVKKSELQKTPETKTTNSKHVKICRLSSPSQRFSITSCQMETKSAVKGKFLISRSVLFFFEAKFFRHMKKQLNVLPFLSTDWQAGGSHKSVTPSSTNSSTLDWRYVHHGYLLGDSQLNPCNNISYTNRLI